MEDLSTRRRIYEEIVLNPGLHFRELQRRLDMPVGMLEYHLNVLLKDELIVSREDGRYIRFFANTYMSHQERKIMGFLRNEIVRKIIIFLLENGRVKQRDIANFVGISPSTLSYHLNKLVKGGILLREIEGRERYYSLKDPKIMARTIIKYRKSFLDSLVDNFVKLWEKRERNI